MTVEDLPDVVRQLVNRHLPSMDHVEVLLFLFRDTSAYHTADAAGAAARLERGEASRVLNDLISAGLVRSTDEGYRYKGDSADREAVEALRVMYETRPVTLVRAIYARPTPVKSFADAFLIRKNKEQ